MWHISHGRKSLPTMPQGECNCNTTFYPIPLLNLFKQFSCLREFFDNEKSVDMLLIECTNYKNTSSLASFSKNNN